MLERKTVLVLGAGASMPYGFPSGVELRRQILAQSVIDSRGVALLENQLDAMHTDNLPDAVREHRLKFQDPSARIGRFHRAFGESEVYSIDAFLAFRLEFEDIGKLCIAEVLAPIENSTRLRNSDPKEAWYQKLWNRMSAGLGDCEASNLTIVTLNYDRSFEEYFTSSASSLYGWGKHEARKKVANLIPVHHVHGALGNWPTDEYGYLRRSNGQAVPDAAFRGAQGIRVLHEGGSYKAATWALREARVIAFLGFSYHRMVLENLFPSDYWQGERNKYVNKPKILGTGFKVGGADRDAAAFTIRRLAGLEPRELVTIGDPDWGTLKALEEMPIITEI